MDKGGYVYILCNRRNGALYTGVTSDLVRRVSQHRLGIFDGFTGEYDIKRLVWSERHDDITAAITREKRIKEWRRSWKIRLIEQENPDWDDLAVRMLRFDPL